MQQGRHGVYLRLKLPHSNCQLQRYHLVGLITAPDGGLKYKVFRIPDELSGVVETQTQNRLCSGRTSLVRDFRSISLALIGRGIEPNNAHFEALYELRAVGNKFNLLIGFLSQSFLLLVLLGSCPTDPL